MKEFCVVAAARHVVDEVPPCLPCSQAANFHQREFCIDNLLVRIHLIIDMILVEQPCTVGGLNFLFQVALYEPSL